MGKQTLTEERQTALREGTMKERTLCGTELQRSSPGEFTVRKFFQCYTLMSYKTKVSELERNALKSRSRKGEGNKYKYKYKYKE